MPLPRAEALERRALLAAGDVLTSVNHPVTGHTYHLLDRTTWDDAEAKSVALGGHLVVVNDAQEDAFLWSTFGPVTGIFWIGLHDTEREGDFVWTTGEPPTYTNWFAGEPNNLYPSGERWGNMWVDYGGKWNDLGPDSEQGTLQFGVAEVRNGPDVFARTSATNVPPSVQPGGVVGVAGTVANLGATPISGPVKVGFLLSADRTLDASDRLVASVEAAGTAQLAFNSSVPIAADLTLPADLAPGTYFLLAQADPEQAVAEADETNNVTVAAALDVGAVMTPVIRTVRGTVRDGDDLPLHGVMVQSGALQAFTDYDKSKKRLDRDGVTGDFELPGVLVGYNVTFGEVFGRFVAATDTETSFTATAGDLTGAAYTASVGLGEVLTLDGNAPDGGLAGPVKAAVELRPIFLADYKTLAPDGSIRLHRDLRNDRHSDRVSTKSRKSLAASGRYQKEVQAVTTRLGDLGFREADGSPLAAVTMLARNSGAARALKLFKDVIANNAAGRGKSRTPAVVDEAALAALNANLPGSPPLWTNVLPPKWSAAPDAVDLFVNRATFEKMSALAASSITTGFVLTRASPATGGTGKTHRIGSEIDFRWIDTTGSSQTAGSFWEPLEGFERRDVTLAGGRKLGVPDPAELNATWRYVPAYDQAATMAVLQSLLDAGATRVRFNDPLILAQLPAIQPAAGYDLVINAAL